MKLISIFIALAFASQMKAQDIRNYPDCSKQKYLEELRITGKQFTQAFYPNYSQFHTLPEKSFVFKIDSVRNIFNSVLNNYKGALDKDYISGQKFEINYHFDKLLIEYPLNHDIYIGKTSSVSSEIPRKLRNNLSDFNKPELLANTDFTNYVKAFFAFQTHHESKKKGL